MNDKPPEPHGNEEPSERPFRQYNPDWNRNVFENPDASWNRQYEWKSTGPRPWYQVFWDILTMRNDVECAEILNEPTADYGHAYGRYAAVSCVIIVLVIAMLAILPGEDTSPRSSSGFNDQRFGNTTTAEDTMTRDELTGTYCVAGPLGIVFGIIGYTIGLGIVHVIATTLFNAHGDFEKLVYGAFSLFTAYSLAAIVILVPLMICVGITAAGPGPSSIYLCLLLPMLAAIVYVYYLYTMVVKTVYSFGWGEAFMSAILIPIGGSALLYCGCIFCFASTSGGA